MRKSKTKELVQLAILVAITVVINRFLAIRIPGQLTITFSFIPILMAGMLYGPLKGGIVGGLSDLIGAIAFPMGGAYFPGFTLNIFLVGLVYGLFFYKKEKSLVRAILASAIVNFIIHFGLGSLWLQIILSNGVVGLLPMRLIKSAIMFVVEVVVMMFLQNLLPKIMKNINK